MSKNEYEHHQKITLHILRHSYIGLGKPVVTNEEKQTKNTVVTSQKK